LEIFSRRRALLKVLFLSHTPRRISGYAPVMKGGSAPDTRLCCAGPAGTRRPISAWICHALVLRRARRDTPEHARARQSTRLCCARARACAAPDTRLCCAGHAGPGAERARLKVFTRSSVSSVTHRKMTIDFLTRFFKNHVVTEYSPNFIDTCIGLYRPIYVYINIPL